MEVSAELVAAIILGCFLLAFLVTCGCCTWRGCIVWRLPWTMRKDNGSEQVPVPDVITKTEGNHYERTPRKIKSEVKTSNKMQSEVESNEGHIEPPDNADGNFVIHLTDGRQWNGEGHKNSRESTTDVLEQPENIYDNCGICMKNYRQPKGEVNYGFHESITNHRDDPDQSSLSDDLEEDSSTEDLPAVKSVQYESQFNYSSTKPNGTGPNITIQNQLGSTAINGYANGAGTNYPYTKPYGRPGGQTGPNQLSTSNIARQEESEDSTTDEPILIEKSESHIQASYPYTKPRGRPGGQTGPNLISATDANLLATQVVKAAESVLTSGYPYTKPNGRPGNQTGPNNI